MAQAKLKAKDLRDQSLEELNAQYDDCCKDLFHIVNQSKQATKLEKPHLLRQKRKNKARILTVMREKELAQSGE